ncbi:MAG: DUF1569 domain-containing protein [Bacteroidota bacterium]|nr:DUF1569 domain-containing protein [Bacteroidota bacterium]
MPSLFEPAVAQSIEQRIQSLQSNYERQWGKMSLSQMMAHVRFVMELGTGEKTEKITLLGKLLSPIIKKVALSKQPYKQGLPTGASFIIKEEKNFEEEKEKLLQTYHHFVSAGEAGVAGKSHPAFGKLTAEEWGFSQWKHLDHHLRQFNA